MLPDHYENLAQTVIAGNLMSENVLSAITTKIIGMSPMSLNH